MSKKFTIYNLQFTIFKKGFTLIELLVVISILGLLAGLVISNVAGVRERARDAERKSDLNQIKQALRMYKNDSNSYPPSATINNNWGTAFANGTTIYMNELPHDPSWTATDPIDYIYTRVDNDNFTLCVALENASDQDAGKSRARCGINIGTQYCVCAD